MSGARGCSQKTMPVLLYIRYGVHMNNQNYDCVAITVVTSCNKRRQAA